MSGGGMTVQLSEDFIYTACTCGWSSLVPVSYALSHQFVACHCGAWLGVDEALIAKLAKVEEIRSSERDMKALSAEFA